MKLDTNHRVTGVNRFPEKVIEIGYMTYWFKWNPASEWMQLPRDTYARYRKDAVACTHGAFRSEMKREWVRACTWCGARPRMVDHCTEGAYLTSSCDSPQCWTMVDTDYEEGREWGDPFWGNEKPRRPHSTLPPLEVADEENPPIRVKGWMYRAHE